MVTAPRRATPATTQQTQRQLGQQPLSHISYSTALPADLTPQRSWDYFPTPSMAAIAPNWKASVHTTPTRPTHRFQLVTTPTSSRPSRLWRRPKPSISVASEELALRCKTKITEASDTAASDESAFRDTTLVTTHTLETPQTARAKDTERVRGEESSKASLAPTVATSAPTASALAPAVDGLRTATGRARLDRCATLPRAPHRAGHFSHSSRLFGPAPYGHAPAHPS